MIFQIISTILLGILVLLMVLLLFGSGFNILGSCIRRGHKKPHKPKKHPHPDKDKDCDKNVDKDCEKNVDKDCDNNRNNFPYQNDYYKYF